MEEEDEIQKYKIVMLGEGRVGKTSLLVRYVKNEFDPKQPPTILRHKNQVELYLEKQVSLINKNIDEKVQLNLWDTAGQEKYNAMLSMYYKNADGAIIVYDLADRESFKKVPKWIQELKNFSESNDIKIFVVGNKSDLNQERQVQKEGEEFCNKLKLKHFYTSCKSKQGIEELFTTVAYDVSQINSQKGAKKFRKSRIQLQDNFKSQVGDQTYEEQQSKSQFQKKKKKKNSGGGCC